MAAFQIPWNDQPFLRELGSPLLVRPFAALDAIETQPREFVGDGLVNNPLATSTYASDCIWPANNDGWDHFPERGRTKLNGIHYDYQ